MAFPGFHRSSAVLRMAATFVILLAFWLILSGYFDLFHVGAGIICCAIVAFISSDLLFRPDRPARASVGSFVRFLLYIPRLMASILVANLDVAYRILHPRMPVDPGIITFETGFSDEVARTAFANAMTLTPGTITVDVSGNRYVVHALMKEHSERELLVDREMEQIFAGIFREER